MGIYLYRAGFRWHRPTVKCRSLWIDAHKKTLLPGFDYSVSSGMSSIQFSRTLLQCFYCTWHSCFYFSLSLFFLFASALCRISDHTHFSCAFHVSTDVDAIKRTQQALLFKKYMNQSGAKFKSGWFNCAEQS